MFRKKDYNEKIPKSVISKVDDQEKEIQRLTQVIAQKDITIKNLERQNTDLKEKYESYINGYAERVEALAEAEREYKKAAIDARNLMARYKAKAEAQIAQMQQVNKILN